MVRIVWTDFAVDDLQSIHDYISKDSKVYADRMIDKIIVRVDQLENFPKSGRVVPEFDDEAIRELI
jgi:toxin ParE1/3/4